MFIRNLSHGVRTLKLVTFIKTYLEYNQLQLQTLDITKFCMRQRKLRHYHKALAKLSNKVGFNVPTLLDPTLLDRLAAHVG